MLSAKRHLDDCESKKGGKQTPTAARPSRLLTAFPFGYHPRVFLSQDRSGGDLQLGYFLFKEQAINLYQTAEQTAS
jgi:hypothetical protein